MNENTVEYTAEWTVRDHESGNEKTFPSRSEAEDAVEDMASMGVDVELVPPGEATGDAPESVEYGELPERSVGTDPMEWVPGDFIDEIDGTPAINRKGFEVLSHFYDIGVRSNVDVAPEETGHEYCRVKAVAVCPDGRECEAYGSAHVDRGDDPPLLLEMADTRARKRALSIATGVGAVAVSELKNEVVE